MNPEQVLALLSLLADLRMQLGALAQENSALRQQLAEQSVDQPASS